MGPEDPSDGRRPDLDAELPQLTLYPDVAPPSVLPGEAHDEGPKLRVDRRAAGFPAPSVGPLALHKLLVPPQECLRADQERRPPLPRQEPARGSQEQPVAWTVPRPADLTAQDVELMTQDGVLEVRRCRSGPRCEPEELAKEEADDRHEHGAAMVQTRCSGGESEFWHPSGTGTPRSIRSSRAPRRSSASSSAGPWPADGSIPPEPGAPGFELATPSG